MVAVCHGADQAQSSLKIYSYRETVKEFVKRYKTNKDASEDRKKGMIGELLVHIILELEGRFLTASPFFNMEERSFKRDTMLLCLKLRLMNCGLQKLNPVIFKRSEKCIVCCCRANKYCKK